MIASTYGYDEDADQIKEVLVEKGASIPSVNPNAKNIRPPLPVHSCQTNWPLLTVSRLIQKIFYVKRLCRIKTKIKNKFIFSEDSSIVKC